jgi:hypothetical protein
MTRRSRFNTFLGWLLLVCTVGVASCQALFHDGAQVPPPPPSLQAPTE